MHVAQHPSLNKLINHEKKKKNSPQGPIFLYKLVRSKRKLVHEAVQF